jgi:hypothetical protein
MAREKTTGFYFKMSPEEAEWFERRMAETGITNKSAFIRKMCIDGHVINLNLTMLNEVRRLLSIIANNVNQIAKRVNSGGEAYREDITDLNGLVTEVRMIMGDILNNVSDIVNPKPGKVFIRPLTIRDLPEYKKSLEES